MKENRDVELTVVVLFLEMSLSLPEDESFHEIPKDVGDELRGLVVEIQGGVIFIDAE